MTRNNSVGENVDKREPSYTVGRNVNLYNYYRKQYSIVVSPKKLKIEIPYDPIITLGTYSNTMKTLIQKHR